MEQAAADQVLQCANSAGAGAGAGAKVCAQSRGNAHGKVEDAVSAERQVGGCGKCQAFAAVARRRSLRYPRMIR